jgi:hypothetical protein
MNVRTVEIKGERSIRPSSAANDVDLNGANSGEHLGRQALNLIDIDYIGQNRWCITVEYALIESIRCTRQGNAGLHADELRRTRLGETGSD